MTRSTTSSCRHARGPIQLSSRIRASAAGPAKSSTLTALTTATTCRWRMISNERWPSTPAPSTPEMASARARQNR
jgi:hypothetical protein